MAFLSMARLSAMAAALLLPILIQAVAFSVDSFDGIATGKPIELTWWGDKSPVTIKLMRGPPEALEPVVNIATNVAGESYMWTPTTIAAGTYCLSITQGSEINYSPQFAVANEFKPSPAPGALPAGTKPSSTATGKAAPIGGPSIGAPGRVPPYVLAAHHPPAGYNNGSRGICGYGLSGRNPSNDFSCVPTLTTSLGHYPTPPFYPTAKGGVGKKGVAIGAGVLAVAIAFMLVL